MDSNADVELQRSFDLMKMYFMEDPPIYMMLYMQKPYPKVLFYFIFLILVDYTYEYDICFGHDQILRWCLIGGPLLVRSIAALDNNECHDQFLISITQQY